MSNKNKPVSSLHPRNKHQGGYDLQHLRSVLPNLESFVFVNDYGKETIDFSDPKAVFELNKALLLDTYKLKYWDIAKNSLCPAIPGRADYIHYLADLLAEAHQGTVPTGSQVHILDIGAGSSLVYPLIGAQEYEWNFTASEIDRTSIHYAEVNINKNPWLKKKIQLRFQNDRNNILEGVIYEKDQFDAVMCNPPFFKSREDNWNSSTKKFTNLNKNKNIPTVQNFGGHANELWCPGGEKAFITQLIYDSLKYKDRLNWITSLVADKDHLKPLLAVLEYHKAADIRIIQTKQGQKLSRILAWKWK